MTKEGISPDLRRTETQRCHKTIADNYVHITAGHIQRPYDVANEVSALSLKQLNKSPWTRQFPLPGSNGRCSEGLTRGRFPLQ